MRFQNRAQAGRRLAERLTRFAGSPDVVVLALPRGGVPVGAQIASRLGTPLDVWLVRKIGLPGQPELAVGALAEGGIVVLHQQVIRQIGIARALVDQVAAREELELERQVRLYRSDRTSPNVRDRIVILVDDGLATGATMEAAILAMRGRHAAKVVVAAPVGAEETCARLAGLADEVECLSTPTPFDAVGLWYDDFTQTSDDEVRALLEAAGRHDGRAETDAGADGGAQ
jgi:putative phosphoribosyl transferase